MPKLHFSLLISLLFLSSFTSRAQHSYVPKKLYEKKEQMNPSTFEITQKMILHADKNESLSSMKIQWKKDYRTYNASWVWNYRTKLDSILRIHKRQYSPGEEEFKKGKPSTSLTNLAEDSAYISYVKKGLTFFQQFFRDTSRVPLLFGNDYDRYEYPSTHTRTVLKNKLKAVYYANGKTDHNIRLCEDQGDVIYLPTRLFIDSMTLQHSLKSISKVDTVIFRKKDIGKTKNGVTLLEMSDNYVCFETPKDYYEEREIGSLMTFEAFNTESKMLATDYFDKDALYFDSLDKKYDYWMKHYKSLYKGIKKAKTKHEAISVLEHYWVELGTLYKRPKNFQFHFLTKGNIDHLQVYVLRDFKTSKLDITITNSRMHQNIFTNRFKNKTDIINKHGETIASFPKKLEFINSIHMGIRGYENTYYLVGNKNFYHYDRSAKKIKKLPEVRRIEYLKDKLAYGCTDNGYIIMDTCGNRTIDEYFKLIYGYKDAIIVQRKNLMHTVVLDNGTKLSNNEYSVIGAFNYGVAKAATNNSVIFINPEGNPINKDKYDLQFIRTGESRIDDAQIVKRNNHYGLIDFKKAAKNTVPCIYKKIHHVHASRGRLYIALKEQYGVIDISGKVLVPFKYSLKEAKILAYGLR